MLFPILWFASLVTPAIWGVNITFGEFNISCISTEFEMGYRPEQPSYEPADASDLRDEMVSTDPELDEELVLRVKELLSPSEEE